MVRRVIQSDPVYAAMIWNLDWNIGRILDELEESGRAENTVVVFTSDNGGLATAEGSPTCNAPAAEGKGWMYEGGLRVPLLVRYPAMIRAGSCCQTAVTTTDFYPTFLELAGVALKKGCASDGRSMVPMFLEKNVKERPIFWHYPHYGNQGGQPGAAVLLGKDKFIEFYENQKEELYDLNMDLSETHNLIEKYPEKAAELREVLHQWQKEVGALFPKRC
ncbi:MAG: sulfatase/phosphatase domain-containing protein [Eisenbergiella sp.]